MKTFGKYVLLNIGIIYGLTLLTAIPGNFEVFLFVPIIISVIALIVGLVLLIPETTRLFGQAMLAGAGFVLILGLGICSVMDSSFM